MEEYKALLIADLSGYTALTETHGSYSAADLIDKYVEIVIACLVGDSSLAERTGDEVLIIASKPDDLLATADMIFQQIMQQEYLLQVHGGLHYGKVLKRNSSYFGSTINLTARIAASANPGSFLCSADFVKALTHPTNFSLRPNGRKQFKNISEETETFELVSKIEGSFSIDPICRMVILDDSKAITHPEQAHLQFCSEGCLNIFHAQHVTELV